MRVSTKETCLHARSGRKYTLETHKSFFCERKRGEREFPAGAFITRRPVTNPGDSFTSSSHIEFKPRKVSTQQREGKKKRIRLPQKIHQDYLLSDLDLSIEISPFLKKLSFLKKNF